MRIDAPGLYEIEDEDYFRDPCPEPSLTQSLAKTLLWRSPLHMWYAHPKLNPLWEKEDHTKFDLGTAAHRLLFGRERVVPVDASDWRTKAAREERERILADGRYPVLEPQLNTIKNMNRVVEGIIPTDAMYERMAVWKTDIWLRTKIDALLLKQRRVIDYKTTSQEVQRDNIQRYGYTHGWHLQAAIQDEILSLLYPSNVPFTHVRLLQETSAPYACYYIHLTNGFIELGRKELEKAIDMFRSCLKSRKWPGPDRATIYLDAPAWAIDTFDSSETDEEKHGENV